MFAAWETFYLMIGTSAAALIGMMFVVITLTAEVALDQINRGTVIYHNPTIFHLAAVVAVSALILVPEHLLAVIAALIVIIAVAGLIYTALTLRRLYEPYEFYTATASDKAFYGFLPLLLYVLLAAGGASIFWAPEFAAEAIGSTVLVLLLVTIRNAWDVATFAVRLSRSTAVKKAETKTAP